MQNIFVIYLDVLILLVVSSVEEQAKEAEEEEEEGSQACRAGASRWGEPTQEGGRREERQEERREGGGGIRGREDRSHWPSIQTVPEDIPSIPGTFQFSHIGVYVAADPTWNNFQDFNLFTDLRNNISLFAFSLTLLW